MSAFDRRGVEVLVQTTKQAEFDFAKWRIPDATQEAVAINLKTLPDSPRDRYRGAIRIREIGELDIAFTLMAAPDLIVMVLSVAPKGEIEKYIDYVLRVSLASLSPAAQEALKGRRKESE